jgi:hypothetical protein
MKRQMLLWPACSVALLFGAAPLSYALPAISIPADVSNAAVRQAASFVAVHPSGLAELAAQLAAKGSKSGPFHDEVKRDAAIMQDIVNKQSVDFGSEIFWDLYRDAVKAAPVDTAVSTIPPAGAPKQSPAVSPAVAGAPAPAPAEPTAAPAAAPTIKVPSEAAGPAVAAETPSPPVPSGGTADAILQKAALALYATYASANSGAKDTDEAFAGFLKDQGLETETGKLRTLLVQVRSLQQASGAAAGSPALAALLADNVGSPAGDNNPPKPQTQPAPEVAPADTIVYAELKASEQAFRAKMAEFQKIAQATDGTDAKKKAAKEIVTETTLELDENLAHQALLRAKFASANAASAVSKATDDATKATLTAAATKSQSDMDLAQASYDALQSQLVLQRNAPADKQADYAKLKAAEPGLSTTLADKKKAASAAQKITDDANATIKDTTASANKVAAAKKTVADNKPKLDAANAAQATAQQQLDANIADQKMLRATVASTYAANVNQAEPSDANQAAETSAADVLATATDSYNKFAATSKGGLPDTTARFANVQGFFHTGVTLVNPYQITATAGNSTATPPTKPTLSVAPSSGTDTNVFLEFELANRWAWNAQRQENVSSEEPGKRFHFLQPYQWDVEGNIGYTFTKSSTSTASTPAGSSSTTPATNLAGDANTIVGSGNFSADLDLSKPLVFYRSEGDDYDFSVGPAVAYGVVTDRSALKAHPRFFWGGVYTAALRDPFGSVDPDNKPRKILLNFRGGWAQIDAVHFMPDPGTTNSFTTNNIFSTNNNLPLFFRNRVNAFETELLYPVKSSTFITFGSRVYSGVSPNPWSVQIGVTLSLADAADSFTNGFLK